MKKVRSLRESRGKSAERSEKRETITIKMRGPMDAMVRSQTRRDGTEKVRSLREKREERREEREERDKHDQDERVEGRNGSVQNEAGWYRKGSVPEREEGREQRKETREKREEIDKHDQDK